MAQWQDNFFVNYGNESYADHAYHNVCLTVQVGRPGSRGIPEPEPLKSKLVYEGEDQDKHEEAM